MDNLFSVVLTAAGKERQAVENDIITWFGERVVDREKLRGGVLVVDEIPKGHTGKVLRKVLRGKFRE